MKITKKLLSSLYIVGLLTASSAAFAADSTDVENTVKYGEKYICDIQTTDQKNYSLEMQWTAEPVTYSQFPEWHNVLTYSLKENGEGIDGGYFSDIGFGNKSLVFDFSWAEYSFVGSEAHSTRIGTIHEAIDIKIDKSYDKDGKTILAVKNFQSSYVYNKFYLSDGNFNSGLKPLESKQVDLKIQSSLCSVVPVSKD